MASIIAGASSYLKVTPSAINLTGAHSAVFAFKLTGNTTNGNYGIVGPHLYDGGDTWFQLYQTAPDMTPANHLFLFYYDSGFNGQDVDLGAISTTVGYHCAWVFDGTNAFFYMLAEGFNPASPSYVITPSLGAVAVASTQASLWIQGTNDAWQTTNCKHAHVMLVEKALSEAEVLAQFRQRAPTSAVTGVQYNYLAMNVAANVNDDLGSDNQDWTKTGSSYTLDAWEPTTWVTDTLFFGCGTTS